MPITLQSLRLRQTATRNSNGDYDWDAILNREIYPALHTIHDSVASINEDNELFEPVHRTAASNAITSAHQHKNLLVSHPTAASLTLDATDSASMPDGTLILIGQEGAGAVKVTGTGGVTSPRH